MDEVRRSLVLQCCTLLCCKIGSFGKARQNLSYPELFGAISRLGWAEVCGVKNRENRWMVWTCWTLGASGVPWPWSKTLPTLMRPISVGHKREHSRWIMILGGHRSLQKWVDMTSFGSIYVSHGQATNFSHWSRALCSNEVLPSYKLVYHLFQLGFFSIMKHHKLELLWL